MSANEMKADRVDQCNCPRNMPYLDWSHDKDCPLYWPMSKRTTPMANKQIEQHVGVSALRKMNAKVLSERDSVVIIHDHLEPLAAMIPYPLYMAVQELRKRLIDGK